MCWMLYVTGKEVTGYNIVHKSKFYSAVTLAKSRMNVDAE